MQKPTHSPRFAWPIECCPPEIYSGSIGAVISLRTPPLERPIGRAEYCSEPQGIRHKNRAFYLAVSLILVCLAACSPAGRKAPLERSPQAPTNSGTPLKTPALTTTPTMGPAATADGTATAEYQNVLYVQSGLNLRAGSAVLLDADSAEILLGKNAFQQRYPASITKVMTAILALEYFELDETVLVGEEVNQAWTKLRINAQKAGFDYGQEFTVKELLYGLLLMSGSDAAFVLAVHTARRQSGQAFAAVDEAVAHFSTMMNERAREIGALDTHFINPDGFHDPEHYSTAYDLALIARYAMQNSAFRQIVGTPVFRTSDHISENGPYALTWQNTNRLLDAQDIHYYAPANGIKTGTTTEAGSCLASSAAFGSRLVIAVVLDSDVESVWTDSISLLEYARQNTPADS